MEYNNPGYRPLTSDAYSSSGGGQRDDTKEYQKAMNKMARGRMSSDYLQKNESSMSLGERLMHNEFV